MRQSHQKSRSRGRNRKPQNPLSRNYESNGPDVKIRGNAGHIAEKYSTLARDALSNGDTVMAENYLQHAEHYNRLIAAAQAQRAEENAAGANGRGPQPDVDGGSRSGEEPASEADAKAESGTEANSESAQEGPSEPSAEPRERKSGRGRRTKRVAEEASEQSAEGGEEKSAAANGSESAAIAEAEFVSDDAASLPQSITGDLRAEEA